MKKWTGYPLPFMASLLLSFIEFLNSLSAQAVDIRVRIAEAAPEVKVRGFDLRIYETKKWGLSLVASADKVSEWEFRCQDGKIRGRMLNAGKNAPLVDLHEPVSIQTPVGFLNFGNQPYRDEFKVYSSGLLCDLINQVDLEKYLDGLVNSEFSSKWKDESIAAQVVTARTYAYYQILKSKENKSVYFDVDATVKDQVYDGSMKEDFHASQIVKKTQGLILTTGSEKNSKPIKAFYHSTCGGTTELPEHVWGQSFDGFKRSVSCPYCSESPRYHWILELKASEIAKAIYRGANRNGPIEGWPKNAMDILKEGQVMDVRMGPLDPEHRVSQVLVVLADGKEAKDFSIPGAKFREWLGPSKLRSTAFQVTFRRADGQSSWIFNGTGNGHGVGMCQWGAKVMGEKGFKMEDILKYYYPDAILRKMW